MSSQQLWALFETTYLAIDLDMAYHAHHLFEDGDKQGIEIEMSVLGNRRTLRGIGSGPIAATVNALALPIRIDNYEERALRAGADASALAIVEAARDGVAGIRYGAGRPIHTRVEMDGGLARLVVRDEGIGIAPELHRRIFDRFYRGVSDRHYGGFGLGLWIVREIVEALGGEIRVESEPGAGATFTIELPLGLKPAEGAADARH